MSETSQAIQKQWILHPQTKLAAWSYWLLGMTPFFWLFWQANSKQLGADPIKALLHESGSWTLKYLLATLAITPLIRIGHWTWLTPFRRTLGILAFSYALSHFLVYTLLDLGLYWPQLIKDITKRPYIIVGFSALLLMIPLAITSNRFWQRKLKRNWKKLHRLTYIILPLAVLHYLWSVKADIVEPLSYAAIAFGLLFYRLWYRFGRN
ncbi:MAG: sulfite oxidase heme-binding subunit YedZ [bacterium]